MFIFHCLISNADTVVQRDGTLGNAPGHRSFKFPRILLYQVTIILAWESVLRYMKLGSIQQRRTVEQKFKFNSSGLKRYRFYRSLSVIIIVNSTVFKLILGTLSFLLWVFCYFQRNICNLQYLQYIFVISVVILLMTSFVWCFHAPLASSPSPESRPQAAAHRGVTLVLSAESLLSCPSCHHALTVY